MDLSRQLDAEKRHLQERSQIAHLQGQLDDLRNRLEQQAARAQLAIEQARQTQDMFAQLEARFDAQVSEARLQEQTRTRSQQSMQKDIADFRSRLEEPARQILTLMSRIQDIQESMRLAREQSARDAQEWQRFDQRIEEVRAQGLLQEERLARLDSLLNRLQAGEEERQQTVRQLREDLGAERQNLRRQAADVERLTADLRGEVQDIFSRINRLSELQRQGAASLEAAMERFDELRQNLDHFASEMKRLEREVVERHLEGQERLESLRQSIQREWGDVREASDRRGESQNTWLRRIEELYHGLDQRLTRRDEEISKTLGSLETRFEAMEKARESFLRDMMGFYQQQMEREIEEQHGPAEPSA